MICGALFTSWFRLVCESQRSQLEFVLLWWCEPTSCKLITFILVTETKPYMPLIVLQSQCTELELLDVNTLSCFSFI